MATPTVKVGDTLPKGEFGWIEYTPELESLVSPPLAIAILLDADMDRVRAPADCVSLIS